MLAFPPLRGGIPRSASLDRLAGRRGTDRQRVEPFRERGGQRRVDQPLPVQPALPSKRFRHDMNTVMGLAARPVSRMPLMQMRFINDLQAFRAESLRQPSRDQFVSGHDDLHRHSFAV